MSNISISVRSHFTREQIEDLLDIAGRGSAYWSTNSRQLEYPRFVKRVFDTKGVWIADSEENEKLHILNLVKIKKGLTCMAKKYPKQFSDFLVGNGDMETGDVFLQCCLFNEIIYS